eukprot:1451142-Lingulodinium_polyedra.AAC.1
MGLTKSRPAAGVSRTTVSSCCRVLVNSFRSLGLKTSAAARSLERGGRTAGTTSEARSAKRAPGR